MAQSAHRRSQAGLNCSKLDALIISGDVANQAEEKEYKAAGIFIENICAEFGVEKSNLVIVPGNHDLSWTISEEAYTPVKKKKLATPPPDGSFIPESETVIQIREEDAYKKRFQAFSRFYEQVKGVPYPIEYGQQATLHPLKALNLLILGLNSAWQVDHHFRARAAICLEALSAALDEIRKKSKEFEKCLKLAVWHHPINSSFEDRIIDHGFMERLAQSGFKVCLHGHLHKTTNELFPYDRSPEGRRIEIVGGGTFGAITKEWYSGYPLQYNLLKISFEQFRDALNLLT